MTLTRHVEHSPIGKYFSRDSEVHEIEGLRTVWNLDAKHFVTLELEVPYVSVDGGSGYVVFELLLGDDVVKRAILNLPEPSGNMGIPVYVSHNIQLEASEGYSAHARVRLIDAEKVHIGHLEYPSTSRASLTMTAAHYSGYDD